MEYLNFEQDEGEERFDPDKTCQMDWASLIIWRLPTICRRGNSPERLQRERVCGSSEWRAERNTSKTDTGA
jgi:hypothetical protein